MSMRDRARQIGRLKFAAAGVLAASLALAAAASEAAPLCKCRARGMTATLGQTLCIPTPDGVRLARCGKMQNVMSWFFLDGPCPQAMLAPLPMSERASAMDKQSVVAP
jgi:hypothetical protein